MPSIAVTFAYSSTDATGLLHLWEETINLADLATLESRLALWASLDDFRLIRVSQPGRKGNPSSWHVAPTSVHAVNA